MPDARTSEIRADEPPFVPRPHQEEARDAMLAARRAGRPGFLLGDLMGVGKTLPIWLALAAMPEREILIVCPRGAVPQWRRTIRRSGPHDKDVTITTYGRTKALLAPPPDSRRRSTRAKNNELAKLGALKRSWPLVVFDEAHRLRNPTSQQSMACRKVADAAAFVVHASATAGQTPHELSYLGRLLGHAAGCDTSTMDGFRALMRRLGIGKAKGRWRNWRWEPNEADRRAMAGILYKGPNAVGLRRRPSDIDGWPEMQRMLAPVALDAEERRQYDAGWREFRREFGLAGGSTRKPRGRTLELRFRQKASLIRVRGTADLAEDVVENGEQAAVSVAFLETAALVEETLRARGLRVGQINGERSDDENEAVRVAFQTGDLDAVIFTVTESISLHQGEMPGGGKGRKLLVHDLRHSAVQTQQIEGRCHRDGQMAAAYYCYAEGTVEEEVAATVVSRMASMEGMAGDDTGILDAIARVIEAAANGECLATAA